ncbi:beta-1,3-galactosyltransferase 1-like isoform X3 [Dreissena polymorpha]|nr:beta-1,3-galactosyltransferase 1-like isoform X3 [Dreissena polymorpha]
MQEFNRVEDNLAMASLSFPRSIIRMVWKQFQRKEITLTSAIVIVLIIFFVGTTLFSPAKPPTFLTRLDDMQIDLNKLKQDTKDAILIEQDDGEVFVAFRLKDFLNDNRGGRLLFTYRPEPQKSSALPLTSATNGRDFTVNMPLPTYPLTLANNTFLINNEQLCSSSLNMSFVVLVHTATDNFLRRASIRETWANHRMFRNHTIRIAFLVGRPEKDSTQVLIEHESVMHKDIIQGNFMDSYRNLTHKGVLGFRWVSEYCSHAKYVVKTDDDVFLNVFKMFEKIDTNVFNKQKHIWCPVRQNGTSEIQREKGKWKIDASLFPNMKHYPVTYCNGYFVILTGDLISSLYEASRTTPFFWIDDVYLFGLLVDKVGGVKFETLPNLNLNENKAIECFNSNVTCDMFVANANSDGVMDRLWFRAINQNIALVKKYSNNLLLKNLNTTKT